MQPRKLLRVGLGGTAIVAVCCFTPALVLLLGAFGLSAWLAWLDYLLLPMLVMFIGITLYAVIQHKKK
jgi:mercuric ion transport protein